MTNATERLSYQRLLEITQKLSGDEQEYVLRFILSNDRKVRKRIEELGETQDILDKKLRILDSKLREVEQRKQFRKEKLERRIAILRAQSKRAKEKKRGYKAKTAEFDGLTAELLRSMRDELVELRRKVGEFEAEKYRGHNYMDIDS